MKCLKGCLPEKMILLIRWIKQGMTKRLLRKQTNKQTVNWKRRTKDAQIFVAARRDGGEEAGAVTGGLSLSAVSPGPPRLLPRPGCAASQCGPGAACAQHWAGRAGAAHRGFTLGCRTHLLGQLLAVAWTGLLRL